MNHILKFHTGIIGDGKIKICIKAAATARRAHASGVNGARLLAESVKAGDLGVWSGLNSTMHDF